MSPPVDFDLPDMILRVLDAEIMVHIGNAGHLQKNEKKSKFDFDPGSPKSIFQGPSAIVVGSVVSKSRRWREERANARDEREVIST